MDMVDADNENAAVGENNDETAEVGKKVRENLDCDQEGEHETKERKGQLRMQSP